MTVVCSYVTNWFCGWLMNSELQMHGICDTLTNFLNLNFDFHTVRFCSTHWLLAVYYFILPLLHVSTRVCVSSSGSSSVLAELHANRMQWLIQLYVLCCYVSVMCRPGVHRPGVHRPGVHRPVCHVQAWRAPACLMCRPGLHRPVCDFAQ
jgi:hypothetical protein